MSKLFKSVLADMAGGVGRVARAGALAAASAVVLLALPAAAQAQPASASFSATDNDGGELNPGDTVTFSFLIVNFPGGTTFEDGSVSVDLDAVLPGLEPQDVALNTFSCGVDAEFNETSTVSFDSIAMTPGNFTCSQSFQAVIPADTAPGVYTFDPSDFTGNDISGASTPFSLAVADFSLNVVADSVDPSAAITGPGGPVAEAFNIRINFSEPVTGFDISDLNVTNATASVIESGDGGLPAEIEDVSIELTPTGGTPITAQLPAATVADAAGNDNTISNLFSVAYDPSPVTGLVDFTMDFIDDPIAPDASVTLRYTIANNSGEDLTGGLFTQTYSSTFSGVSATALPAGGYCGAGSAISGTTFVIASDINLLDGESCSFDVTLDTPAGIPAGANASSTSSLSYTLSTSGAQTDDPASDSLLIQGAEESGGFINFSKEFTDDPVSPGDTATLEFTIGAGGDFSVTGISFTDDLDAALSGLVATGLPASDVCGAGSTLSGTDTLTLSGGNLATGALCTFSVTLAVPGGAAAGDYANTTSTLSATRSDIGAVTVAAAADTLSIVAADPVPTVIVAREGSGDVGVGVPFGVQFRFSEPVTGFLAGEVLLTNAWIGPLVDTGDSTIFEANVTPLATGAVEVSVPAGAAQDSSVQDNLVSNTLSAIAVTPAPEIAVAGGGLDITTGDISPSLDDGTFFGSADPAGGVTLRTFTISNSGTGDLTLTGGTPVTLSGANSDDFSVTSQPSSPVAAGGSTSFQIQFDPSALGDREATVSIANDDADEAPFTFAILGEGSVAPEINVTDDSGALDILTGDVSPQSADGTDFGSMAVGGTAVSQTFIIENTGTSTLTLGASAVTISGSDAFTVNTQPATSIASSGTSSFVIDYVASQVGPQQATISIANDDADEAPYTFGVTGSGLDQTAPSGFTVAFDADPYGPANVANASFTISDGEPLADYDYSISSSGGGAPVTGSGTIPVREAGATPEDQITGLDLSGLSDGTLTVSIILTDPSGNASSPATDTATLDTTGPGVTLSSVSSDPVSGVFTLDVVFDESVTGFVIGDLNVANGAASGFSGSGTTYSATITPSADGAVTVDVAAGVAQDAAGNTNTAATQFSITNDETAPDVTISTLSSDPVSGAFSISVVFTESVTGFVVGDLNVGNGAASAFSGSGTTYSATITPSGDGAVTVDVAAGVAQDAAGNTNTAATQFSITNDETAPSVTLSTASTDPVSGAFTLNIVFDESVTGFVIGDLNVSNGAASAFSGSGTTYSATITPSGDGAVTVDVAAGVAQDSAGNGNTAATQFSITNDETAPGVTLSSGSTDPVSGTFTLNIVFDESVTGFVIGDLNVANGAASAFSGSGTTYSATITPAADGVVTVDVAAGVAQDSAGNTNTAATQFSITNDETAPDVTISTLSSDPVSGAFSISVVFDESVTGFVVGDLNVGNGAASGFSGSGTTYSATITPSGDGAVTVDVAAGVAQDSAGNDNTAATQFSITNDETAPDVTISTLSSDPVSGAFSISVVFTESVTGFVVGDLNVGNGAASAFSGSGTTYSATITPSGDGAVTVDVAAGVAQDGAGNGNTAATQFSITNDETAPGVTLSSGSTDPVSGAFNLNIVFDESVTGFVIGDLNVANGAASAFSGSGTTYSATITPAADGVVTVDVAAGVAQDSAGNTNTAATQFSITNDETAPDVTLSTASTDPVSGAFTLNVDFTESVTGFGLADLDVSNGVASGLAGAGANYTVTITPDADGVVTVDVAAGVAQDSAGNDNTAATQFSITNDETAPTVTVSSSDPVFFDDPSDAAYLVSGAFTVDIEFSEAVTGLTTGGISVTNGSASGLTGSGTSYSVTITPSADGVVTVEVDAGAAQDSAGNDNVAGDLADTVGDDVVNDETAPTPRVTAGPVGTVTGPAGFEIVFGSGSQLDPSTGFDQSDLVVSNGAVSGFGVLGENATAGTIYGVVFTLTPTADGPVSVDIAAGAFTDFVGNSSLAMTQFSFTADVSAPTVASITPSDALLEQVDAGSPVSLDVLFDEAMNTSLTPALAFSEDVSGTLSLTGGSWSGDMLTYTATYDVADNSDVFADLDVTVSNASDAAGNALADQTIDDVFSIDMGQGALRVEIVSLGGDPLVPVTIVGAVEGSIFDSSITNFGAFAPRPDTYTITATTPADYTLESLVCTDPDGGSSVDLAGGVATADLDNRESVTCVFTYQGRGDITIVGVAEEADGDFDFTGDLGDFTLAAVSAPGTSRLFAGQPAGTYEISLPEVDGFEFEDLVCTGDAGSSTSGSTATVNLDPGEDVVCTFTQEATPNLEVDETLTLTLDLPTNIDDPASVTADIPLTNTGNVDLDFTAFADVPWITVAPSSGTVAPGESINVTVSLNDGIDDLEAGTYNATITLTRAASGSGAGPSAPNGTTDEQIVEIPLTLTLQPRRGTVQFVTTTRPAAAGEASFSYASTIDAFDGLSLTTSGQRAASSVEEVLRGTYTITQSAPEGWRIDSATCEGDLDGGSSVDLATGVLTLDLDPDEALVCIFTNVRDEAAVVLATQRAIRNFMVRRADRIIEAQPDLSRRFEGRESMAGGGFRADATEGRWTMGMTASLSGMRNKARAEASAGGQAGEMDEGNDRFDLWLSAEFASVSDDRAGEAADSDFGTLQIGADYLVSDNLVIGAMAMNDWASEASSTVATELGAIAGAQVEGDGWLAGPYLVRRLGEDGPVLDLRALFGGSSNTVNPLGLYEDEFDTERLLVQANLTGQIEHGAWRIRPSAGLTHYEESQEAYIDSLGIIIPEQSISIGRLNFGPEFAYRFQTRGGGFIEPSIRVNGIWDYSDAGLMDATGAILDTGDMRADARLGLAAEFANGARFELDASFGGIGDGDFEANSAGFRVRLPM